MCNNLIGIEQMKKAVTVKVNNVKRSIKVIKLQIAKEKSKCSQTQTVCDTMTVHYECVNKLTIFQLHITENL